MKKGNKTDETLEVGARGGPGPVLSGRTSGRGKTAASMFERFFCYCF